MQISEQTRWRLVYVLLAIIGIAVTAITAMRSTNALKSSLDGAFTRAESTIETGFSRTELTTDENTAILALSSKSNRPAWSAFLRRAKGEAIDKGYVKVTPKGFITTEAGEKKLSVFLQEEIQNIVKRNPAINFDELAANVVEGLGIRRLSLLARGKNLSLNEMIAIVAGFAGKMQTKG